MKTVVIGDIHGRSTWKLITHLEQPDRVIFVGDYFDSWDLSGVEQIHNFKEIIEYKETSFVNKGTLDQHKTDVILLIGNHDFHYMPGATETYSGYQHKIAPSITQVLDENKNHLQMAYQMDEYLFTHAGVSSKFLDNVFMDYGWKTENIATDLNELYKYKPKQFEFGMAVDIRKMSWLDPSGDNEEQSPIWIRPRSLMRSNRDTLRKQVIQIVGHTEVKKLDLNGSEKTAGGRYYFVDCLGTSNEYLIIEDSNMRVGWAG
jgi:predicted phosphodiesterase